MQIGNNKMRYRRRFSVLCNVPLDCTRKEFERTIYRTNIKLVFDFIHYLKAICSSNEFHYDYSVGNNISTYTCNYPKFQMPNFILYADFILCTSTTSTSSFMHEFVHEWLFFNQRIYFYLVITWLHLPRVWF